VDDYILNGCSGKMGLFGIINMKLSRNPILAVLLWGLVFALAYSQSPLYTSNQNQYFLHGLVQAGYGDLSHDWLANTADPTPLFSQVVKLTYQYLQWEGFYYVIYAFLMAIYLYSLWSIVVDLYDWQALSSQVLLFLSLMVLVHSAGWRYGLSLFVGVNWTYILEDGVADQRLLGPVLQPSAFGVFLLFSINLFMKRSYVLAILAAALAALFHPTYLLSAAILTFAYLIDIIVQEHNWKKAVALGGLALAAVTPILLVIYPVYAGAPAELAAKARQVLVEFRIPHHALVSQWLDITAVIKIGLVLLALFLVWKTRLITVIGISLLVVTLLTLLQVASGSIGLALLFPWRPSTFLVPLSSAVILAHLLNWLLDRPALSKPAAQKVVALFSLGIALIAVLSGVLRFTLDLQRKSLSAEREVQAYIADRRLPGDVYLVPIKMQDFRLAAGASAFVDFKSIPYQSDEVLEWYRREQLAERYYKSDDCAALDEILAEYALTHVITEEGKPNAICPGMDLIYTDGAYHLWRVGQ
jgi:hypothetical protein